MKTCSSNLDSASPTFPPLYGKELNKDWSGSCSPTSNSHPESHKEASRGPYASPHLGAGGWCLDRTDLRKMAAFCISGKLGTEEWRPNLWEFKGLTGGTEGGEQPGLPTACYGCIYEYIFIYYSLFIFFLPGNSICLRTWAHQSYIRNNPPTFRDWLSCM